MWQTSRIFSQFFIIFLNYWYFDLANLIMIGFDLAVSESPWIIDLYLYIFVQVSKLIGHPTNCQNPVQTTNVWTARRSMKLSIGRAHFAEYYIVAQDLRRQNAVPVKDFNGQPPSNKLHLTFQPGNRSRATMAESQSPELKDLLCCYTFSMVHSLWYFIYPLCWKNMNNA